MYTAGDYCAMGRGNWGLEFVTAPPLRTTSVTKKALCIPTFVLLWAFSSVPPPPSFQTHVFPVRLDDPGKQNHSPGDS